MMFQSIIQDVRNEFQKGNTITRLIFINLFVYIALNLLYVFLHGTAPGVYGDIRNALALSNGWMHNLTHPWAWLTHMFVHDSFWHILWNMLFLYWFGRIVGDLIGDHHMLPIYIYGGLLGGLSFVLTASALGYVSGTTFAIGASGATMAIVLAAGIIAPDYMMRLILIGSVKLKYIVLAILLLDIFRLAGSTNVGGHVAHLGGAAMGWFYIYALRSGMEIGKPIMQLQTMIMNLFDGPRKPRRSKARVFDMRGERQSEPQAGSSDVQEKVDAILDKISQKGYDSLSDEEKEFLYQASKK
jgi:membrane associated rhomboid family serine protease